MWFLFKISEVELKSFKLKQCPDEMLLQTLIFLRIFIESDEKAMTCRRCVIIKAHQDYILRLFTCILSASTVFWLFHPAVICHMMMLLYTNTFITEFAVRLKCIRMRREFEHEIINLKIHQIWNFSTHHLPQTPSHLC